MLTFVIFIVIAFVMGLVLYSAWIGGQAWWRAMHTHDEAAVLLQYFGLNLCEPLVNSVLITVLVLNLERLVLNHDLPYLLLVTIPMAVLLVPAGALQFHDPQLRAIGKRILQLGLYRWGLVILVYGSLWLANWVGEPWGILLGALSMIILPGITTILLFQTVKWVRDQLKLPLLHTPSQSANTAVVQSVAAARPAMPLPSTHAPALPALELACPQCHALGQIYGSECAQCGLVYASRIPADLRNIMRYTVVRPLSDGGMSRVYLGYDRAIEQWAVLKLVDVADQFQPGWQHDAYRCLEHEATLLRGLHHSGIAAWLGWYPEGPHPFLALEYVAGTTIDQLLLAGKLPLGAALDHAAAIADVICYLSSRPHPIAHCDIKPSNIVIAAHTSRAYLIDFGSAQILAPPDDPTTRERYGTPGYAAPEQYQGNATIRSDVYGLAATLYQMLTEDDPSQHPLAFPAIGMLPPQLATLLGQALSREPEQRPTPHAFRDTLRLLARSYQRDGLLVGA